MFIRLCRGCVIAMGLILASASLGRADDAADLGVQAQAILKTHCYNCHGVNFNGSSKLNVMDRESLIKHEYVVPGEEGNSPILGRIESGEMPPEDSKVPPVSEEDRIVLVKWVAAGAPLPGSKQREFVPFSSVLEHIHEDLLTHRLEDRRHMRYFSLRHLNNNPEHVSDFDLRLYRAALSKVINSLTYEREIVIPHALDEGETLFRIDMRDLGWTDGQWNRMLKGYPYGIHFDNSVDPQLANLSEQIGELTETKVSWVRADWFINLSTRPQIYDSYLNIPKNVSDLEKRLGVDFETNFLNDRLVRGGFATSGVSKGARAVERHPSFFGYYWKSYDFKPGNARGNVFRLPLGPEFEKNDYPTLAFEHDGGEMIFSLPNGLQGYMLTDTQGNKIEKGPIDLVRDGLETSGTPEIVNGISCMHCHRHGVINFTDTVRGGAGVFDQARQKVNSLYPEQEEIDALLQKDRRQFLAALEKTIGPFMRVGQDTDRPLEEFPEPVGAIARFYQRDLDLQTAASELGYENPDELKAAIKANTELIRLGMATLAEGGTIKRSDWENTANLLSPFQESVLALRLATPVSN